MVIKRCNTNGLTVGRANDICSYARNFCDGDKAETSNEWAILSFYSKPGAFSAKDDSGSAIVDNLGHIGGLLTGGAGTTPSSVVTYAAPIRRIRQIDSQQNTAIYPGDAGQAALSDQAISFLFPLFLRLLLLSPLLFLPTLSSSATLLLLLLLSTPFPVGWSSAELPGTSFVRPSVSCGT